MVREDLGANGGIPVCRWFVKKAVQTLFKGQTSVPGSPKRETGAKKKNQAIA